MIQEPTETSGWCTLCTFLAKPPEFPGNITPSQNENEGFFRQARYPILEYECPLLPGFRSGELMQGTSRMLTVLENLSEHCHAPLLTAFGANFG